MAVTNYYSIGGEVIAERTAGSARVDYLTDALGSKTATVNQSAQVVNTYRYKPAGSQLAKTGIGPDPKFGWAGYLPTQKRFSEHYLRGRHVSDLIGVFTAKDKFTSAVSPYAYALNNPVLFTDPGGFVPCRSTQPAEDCSTWPGGPCAYAKHAKVATDPGELGTVVCCNGEPTICVWPEKIPPWLITPPAVILCLYKHEGEHFGDTECTGSGFYVIRHTPAEQRERECDAHRVGMYCLQQQKQNQCQNRRSDKAACLREYHEWICQVCDQMEHFNCPMMPAYCLEWC